MGGVLRPGEKLFELARKRFDPNLIRHDYIPPKSAAPDFPVKMYDNTIQSSLKVSQVLMTLPSIEIDSLFCCKSILRDALRWRDDIRAEALDLIKQGEMYENNNQDTRVSIVLELAARLKAKGSWCGETHIQKTTFILQCLGAQELDYEFVLYKHGPYSFDLHSELAVLRSANLISLVVLRDRYGPSYEVTEIWGSRFMERHQAQIKNVKKKINFVAEWVGDWDVKALERISTALMIARDNPQNSVDSRAQLLNRLKPHITLVEAERATRQVDMKWEEARKLKVLFN